MLPTGTVALSYHLRGNTSLSLIPLGNPSCLDLALGNWDPGAWSGLLQLPGGLGGGCGFFQGEEPDLAFLALPMPPMSLELTARSLTCWRVVICFCPINFLKGQKRIAGLEGWPREHTDEELAV